MFRIVSSSTSPVPTYVADTASDLEAIRTEQYDSNMIGISAIVLAGQGAGTYVLTGSKQWIPYNTCGCGGGSGSGGGSAIDPTTIIKDSVTATNSVWSSEKTSQMIGGLLDDDTVSLTSTWSSTKISQELQNLNIDFDLICGGDAEALPLTPDGLEDAETKGW